jgi:hypothetical protein
MSDAFYNDMVGIAGDLITEYQQGTMLLERRTQPPATPPEWNPPPPELQQYPIVGVARNVDRRFVDGTLVMATDRMVTFPARSLPVGIEPQMTDVLYVDGAPTTIKKVIRVPEAGIIIVFKLILGS